MISIINTALSICSLLPSLAKTFSKWFGKHDANSVAELLVNMAQSITATNNVAEMLDKLRNDEKLLNSLQETIVKTETEMELALVKDCQNARERDIVLAKHGARNIRADIMILAASLGLVICLIFIAQCQKDIPGEIIGIVSTVAGIFGACLKDAYSFEFGSSRSRNNYNFNKY